MYTLIKRLLFCLDAEQAHTFAMKCLSYLSKVPILATLTKKCFSYNHPTLPCTIWGINFKNRVGLAAGFDKNADYIYPLSLLGFGFIEIGTVTPLAQAGNTKPRLFRLIEDEAIINRMGFNNKGMDYVAHQLKQVREQHSNLPVIGVNMGKNKQTPNELAVNDYLQVLQKLYDYGDYFVVNISSPNTPGLRSLQHKDALINILAPLQKWINHQPTQKPLLLKIAPDLSHDEVKDIIEVVQQVAISGIITSNTTISRTNLSTKGSQQAKQMGDGGLSGAPLLQASNQMLQFVHQHQWSDMPIVGSGGIIQADDALQKLQLGASLVQVWTGFVYSGPSLIKNINKLVAKHYSAPVASN